MSDRVFQVSGVGCFLSEIFWGGGERIGNRATLSRGSLEAELTANTPLFRVDCKHGVQSDCRHSQLSGVCSQRCRHPQFRRIRCAELFHAAGGRGLRVESSQGYLADKKLPTPRPYSRPMPRPLWWS